MQSEESLVNTVPTKGPCTVSCLNECATAFASVNGWFTATT